MNGFIERLTSLNPTAKTGEDFTGGCKIEVTNQELLGSMVGEDEYYTDFIINVIYRQPCSSKSRDEMTVNCIKLIRQYENSRGALYKDRKPLSDDDSMGLSRMALDWMIQGYVDLSEPEICRFASQYLTKQVKPATWVKKYEPIFISVVSEVMQEVANICNRSKPKTGIYE